MLKILLKNMVKIKNKHDLDAKIWIQKALIAKIFINNSF
jgi:hypothetical protein